MPTVTVQELIDRAKAAADMRDNFVTAPQWEAWATQERYALDLFLARSGWTQTLSEWDITVTGDEAGVFNINPTNGVMAVVCVHQYSSQGVRQVNPADPVNFLHQIPGNSTNPKGHSSQYRITRDGDDLVMNLYPEPAPGETYRVTYIAHPLKLTLTDRSTAATYPVITLVGDGSLDLGDFSFRWYAAGTEGNGWALTLNAYPANPSGGVLESINWTTRTISIEIDTNTTPSVLTISDLADLIVTSSGTTVPDGFTGEGTSLEALVSTTTSTLDLGPTFVCIAGGTSAGGEAAVTNASLGYALSVSYPMGWEERIVLGMARRALIKEESETRAIDSEIAIWESRIEEACWDRILTSSPAVRNTDYTNRGWHKGWMDRMTLPNPSLWWWI